MVFVVVEDVLDQLAPRVAHQVITQAALTQVHLEPVVIGLAALGAHGERRHGAAHRPDLIGEILFAAQVDVEDQMLVARLALENLHRYALLA